MKRLMMLLCLLVITSLACGTVNTAQLPTGTPQAKGNQGSASTVLPTHIKTMQVCLTAEAVNLRSGAGTGFEAVRVLSAGDNVTIGTMTISEDSGVWYSVTTQDGQAGFMNARYLCVNGE